MSTLAILTQPEKEAFEAAEADIRDGMSGFKKTGAALQLVRDCRLYRAEFKSFEDYCQDRWGFNKNNASMKIQNAAVARQLEANGVVVEIESHAAALAKIPEADRIKIFDQVRQECGGAVKMTAARIIQAAGLAPTETTTTAVPAERKIERELERAELAFLEMLEADNAPHDITKIEQTVRHLFLEVETRVIEQAPHIVPEIAKTCRKILDRIEKLQPVSV